MTQINDIPLFDLEETDTKITISNQPIPTFDGLFILHFINNSTYNPFSPSPVIDHQQSHDLSESDLSALFTLGIRLSPQIMIHTHIFFFHTDHSIFTSSSIPFRHITDREVRKTAFSEAVITENHEMHT
jgi:hypothetical protein